MAKAYGVRPSSILRASAGEFALDQAVWGVGCEVENALGKAKDEAGREAILGRLRRDAEAPDRSREARKRRKRGGRS